MTTITILVLLGQFKTSCSIQFSNQSNLHTTTLLVQKASNTTPMYKYYKWYQYINTK